MHQEGNHITRHFFSFLLYIWPVFVLISCAQTGNLSGGKKDVSEPVLDTLRSTPSKNINFNPNELVFYFDEFVVVKDPLKQVLISPPLVYLPKIKERGKRITVKIDEKEVLRPNTTYTFNFGEAIRDFHEGNIYKNFKYVFSTGSELDSMSISGKLVDAVTGKAPEEMLVFLYDSMADSIVRKEKPMYSTRTDKEGAFLFENIRSDTFKIFALKDDNVNFLYDLPTELIAFSDTLVYLENGAKPVIQMRVSKPLPKFDISTINAKSYGKINILFNQPARTIPFFSDQDSLGLYPEIMKDSLNIFYNTTDSFQLFLPGFDTIKVKPRMVKEFNKKKSIRTVAKSASKTMLHTDTLYVVYDEPIATYDKSLIKLSDDISEIEDFAILRDTSHKKLMFLFDWSEGIDYNLVIDSAAVRSIYGRVNDSISITAGFLAADKKSKISVKITDLDSTKYYHINVLREQNIIKSVAIRDLKETTISLGGLVPDRYDLNIIQDDDLNGKWDAADYWLHRQAEYFKDIKGEKTKENWQSLYTVSWKTGTIKGANEPNSFPTSLKPNTSPKGKN
jgi:hypothetical protein